MIDGTVPNPGLVAPSVDRAPGLGVVHRAAVPRRREVLRSARRATHRAGDEYLALVPYHPDRQADGTTDRQVALVDRFLPAGRAWGICTECGMARAERADVPRLLDLHREILDRHQPAR